MMDAPFKSKTLVTLINVKNVLSLIYILNLSLTLCIGLDVANNSTKSVNDDKYLTNNHKSDVQSRKLSNKIDVKNENSTDVKPTSTTEHTSTNIEINYVLNDNKTKGVWCYCNFPQCVPNGYMCQSVEGKACFSKRAAHQASISTHLSSGNILHHVPTDSLIRGCVEHLSNSDKAFCYEMLGSADITVTPTQRHRLKGVSEVGEKEDRSAQGLQCCNQNVCNYEKSKPIIIREIDGHDSNLSRSVWLLKGVTIGVSVAGVIVLVFLFIFAGRMLTSEEKGRSSQFLHQHTSRDLYIKVPYYIERTPSIAPVEGEGCSVLCVKSLQKNLQKKQDVADYCRFHPLSSSSNRHSLSCPSSLASCPTSYQEYGNKEEREPLTDEFVGAPSSNSGSSEKDEILFRPDQLGVSSCDKS